MPVVCEDFRRSHFQLPAANFMVMHSWHRQIQLLRFAGASSTSFPLVAMSTLCASAIFKSGHRTQTLGRIGGTYTMQMDKQRALCALVPRQSSHSAAHPRAQIEAKFIARCKSEPPLDLPLENGGRCCIRADQRWPPIRKAEEKSRRRWRRRATDWIRLLCISNSNVASQRVSRCVCAQ